MIADKFKELVLYVARKSEGDPNFGAIKLNKLLFFSDFLSYRAYGSSISAETYFKLPLGPAPRRLLPALRQLEESQACYQIERNYFGKIQKRVLARRDPDLALFSAAEISLVDEVIRILWDNDGREVSELSHRFIGWQAASDQEDIPYETVFVGDPAIVPLTDDEMEYGRQLACELGEQA
jgi:hypothetical protein